MDDLRSHAADAHAELLAIPGRSAAADQFTGPGLPALRPGPDRASAA